MAWSTRELAELAGTTVNAIRHYHRIALLDEPERRYNGYKQYGVADLMRLLRIRRLSELGVPLSQIRAICVDGAPAPDVLRQVDAGLAAEIERLEQARTDIAIILRTGTPAGLDLLVRSGVLGHEHLCDIQAPSAADGSTASAECVGANAR